MFEKIKALLFRNVTTRQTVAKNTFWAGMSQFGGRLLRAVVIIYGARVLGAGEYGAFSYALSLAAFLSLFIDIGISPILIRETAKTVDAHRRAQILSTSFFIKIALLLFCVALVLSLAPIIAKDNSVKILIPIIIFIMAFDMFREFGFSLIRALEKMEWETGLYLLTNAGIVIFGFIFLYFSQTARSFAYSYALGDAVGVVATAYALRSHFKNILANFSAKLVGFIFSSAWPFAISAALGVLLTNTDILIIGWLKTTTDVGLYSATLRIVQILYLLPAIITISILPALSRFVERDSGKFRIALERILSLSYLASIPMALGGVILSEKIINLVFGAGYLGAAPSYQILMLTLLVDYPAVILSNAVFAYNRQRNLIWFAAIGGFFNVLFDLILIPRFGIVGSAWATLCAQTISNAYLWRTMNKVNPFRVLPHLKKIVSAAVLMAIFALTMSYLNVNVLVIIAASALLYFGLLVALKEPLLKEIKLILQPAASDEPANSEPAA